MCRPCRLVSVLTISLWVIAGPAVAASVSRHQVETINAVVLDYVSPHTKWAQPYAGGSIRMLYIGALAANVNVAPTRGAVELAQRFDLEVDAVLVMPAKGTAYAINYEGDSGVYGGDEGEQRLKRLLETPYDCYVITAHEIAGHLPVEALGAVLDHVRQGAGLVLPQLDAYATIDKHVKIGAAQVDSLPHALAGLSAQAYELGAGRIVEVKPPDWSSVYSQNDACGRIFGIDLLRDVHFSAYGKAVLWSARREPQLHLDVAFDERAVAQVGGRDIEVTWSGTPVGSSLEVSGRVRSRGRGGRLLQSLGSQGMTDGRVSFAMPSLPAGDYFIEVTAKSDRGAEAWSVRQLDVTTTETLKNLHLRREWCEPGEAIVGSIDVDTPHRDRRTLHVQLIDRYGRVLSRRTFDAPQERVAFTLPTDASMPAFVTVEAVLADFDRPLHHAYANCTIVRRGQGDFNFVMWGRLYAHTYVDMADELLAQSGVTTRLETSSVPWWYMTRSGMNYAPYCSSGLQRQHWSRSGRASSISLDGSGVLTKGCWNDEPAVTERLRQWLGDERDYRRHGVLTYSMGDEVETYGSCLHPSCMAAYRLYLQRQYGDIEALNASWGTDFKQFSDVRLTEPVENEEKPVLPEDNEENSGIPTSNEENQALQAEAEAKRIRALQADNEEKQAFAQKNYPRWFDRRAFQAVNLASYVGRFGRAAREIDPRAWHGVEGTGWLDDDLDAIVRDSTWWMLYSIPATEVVRSIVPKGYSYGVWIGYTTTQPYYPLSDFWLGFLRGANCNGWWRVDNFLGPHFSLSAGSSEMVRTARVVFDGLGKLLNVESRPEHDGIVLLHSFASSQAASFIEPGPTYGTYSGWMTNSESEANKGLDWALKPGGKSHLVWHRAIRALGLQFEYVTDRMLRRGEFRPDDCKVMILSQCEALGPREAKVIRRFVLDGGTLVADVRPGLYDDHCKALASGALDDLFGVRHTGNVEAVEVDGRALGRIGDRRVDVELSGLHVNPAVELTTGKALGHAGSTPIMIVNRAGRGRALLMNFTMGTFPNLSRPETDESAADLIAAIFAQAGVQWPLRLLDSEAARCRNVEAVRWKTGEGIEVVAVYGPLDDGRAQWRPREGLMDRLRAADKPRPVTIRLPRARHVRQVGSNQRFGKTRSVTVPSHPWRPTFVVLSEGRLQAPKLAPNRAVAVKGQMLRFHVSVPKTSGSHALRVRVTAPDGREARWFASSVITGPNGAHLDLPIALNEQSGSWQVKVTDLYTGAAANSRFTVR